MNFEDNEIVRNAIEKIQNDDKKLRRLVTLLYAFAYERKHEEETSTDFLAIVKKQSKELFEELK